MAMQRRQEDDGMITKVVSINRVSKTVKGGRVMKFAALIVVGDGKGNIGYGVGKSGEVPEAIRKGEGAAKKNMRKVCLKGTTIPHEIVGEYGAGVRAACMKYLEHGCSVNIRVYPEARHELLFELNADEVMNDILAFINKRL